MNDRVAIDIAGGVAEFSKPAGIQVHFQRADLLRQIVMQFTGDPPALVVLTLQQLGRQFL